ncbi:MAG TPA: hypothetical protein VK595_11745, partial [Vicinamibacterales bacterium]|nr:hypothetical protein [Vicinamibacterales bacterium]
MPRGIPVSAEVRRRIEAVAIGEGRGPSETSRRLARGMDGGAPIEVPAETVRRTVARIRRDGEADVRPRALAARMLRVLERELAALEAKRGPADLERLDRIAATLRRLDPLQSERNGPDRSEPAG